MSSRVILKNLFFEFLPFYQFLKVKMLKQKKQINVVLFAMSLSMWRYQHIYEQLSKHPKFKVSIVILPSCSYLLEQQMKDVSALEKYFQDKQIPYILAEANGVPRIDVRKDLAPDVMFYPQPYYNYYPKRYAYNSFYDKLLCYSPYAFWMSQGEWSYNQPLHRTAWKLFYPTDLHRKDAFAYSSRKGKNMEVVGYPTADDFLTDNYKDVWKFQPKLKKRVIWSPHFTIFEGGYVTHSNFLWMADFMREIVYRYSGQIQFTFKPHPRLYSELCRHTDWGETKALEYYSFWEQMPNTQLETGEFVDLFMTSDAMIHDCGSFAVEYHYSENPVMYIAQNFEDQVAEKNDFGKIAMKLHYVGKCKDDIIDFIENVVLKGDDPMKPQRQQFKQDYLLPPNGKTVAENTMDVFLKAFC